MNKTIITGNVGTVKEGANGENKVLNFTVAVNEYYTNQKKEKVTKTIWYECALWDRENLYQYIKKGTHVLIEGSAGARAYLNDKNEAIAVQTLKVDIIEFSNKDKAEEAKV